MAFAFRRFGKAEGRVNRRGRLDPSAFFRRGGMADKGGRHVFQHVPR